ncbi:unnamed protein product [Effrenium voratum]|nr:unnamed protein product [Effrenium voratum]
MQDVLSLRTLVVKILGLMLSVSSGLALGKEGPTVHIACCWANVCSQWSRRYSTELRRRELLSVAAAAGVSVAFGAPVGGVLFSYEEVSTRFPRATMIRAFFSAVVAALTLAWYDPLGTGKLTLFEVSYQNEPALLEYPLFLAMGCVGGLVGALFVKLNIQISEARKDGSAFREKVPITLEVALIALFTAITSYPSIYTRDLSSLAIHSLFCSCSSPTNGVDRLTLCEGDQEAASASLVAALLLAAAVRFAQVTVTFGTGVPCGLFVPSLYVGACLGRCLGIVAAWGNGYLHFAQRVHPGVYAMVGAASVLGGVCRVTISLVVIMFELTGGTHLILPFMIAVLAAKWVGDLFNDSIYDCCIHLRGYPYLHEPGDVTYSTRACDVMQEELHCLGVEPGPLGVLLKELREAPFKGFPVVKSEDDFSVVGYVKSKPLQKFLEDQLCQNNDDSVPVSFRGRPGAINADFLLDTSVLSVVPDTPVAQVHSIFRHMGGKLVFVTRLGQVVGIITKKHFLHCLSRSLDQEVEGLDVDQKSSEHSSYLQAYCHETSSYGLLSSPEESPDASPEVSPKTNITRASVSFIRHSLPSREFSLENMRQSAVRALKSCPVVATRSQSENPGGRKARHSAIQSISWPAEVNKGSSGRDLRKSGLHLGLPAVIGLLSGMTRCFLIWSISSFLEKLYEEGAALTLSAWEHLRWSLVCVALAVLAARLNWRVPCTASGMSEVKTILNGFVMDERLSFDVLFSRSLGLVFASAARLCLDLQGVMLHLAACWADLCYRLSSINNEATRRELISVACAAGISAAFGTPLGGVLWSYEQMSSKFTQQTLIYAFLASILADLVVDAYAQRFDAVREELQSLGARYDHLPAFVEYVVFVFLGVLGGVLGAACIFYNMLVCRARQNWGWTKWGVWGSISITLVTLCSCAISWFSPLLFRQDDALQALFASCTSRSPLAESFGICSGSVTAMHSEVAWSLCGCALLCWLELAITYDAGTPGGYFISSLLIGGCLGRGTGILVHEFGQWSQVPLPSQPGVYAMVGAAAMLAGITRVHISLVVMMFELTGALQLVVPFMVAIMTANWVGSLLTCSMDECHISLRGYPHLMSESVVFKSRAGDVMDEELECLTCNACQISVLTKLVNQAEYGGFPVIVSEEDRALVGYVSTESLREYLQQLPVRVTMKNPMASFQPLDDKTLDLSSLVDRTVIQIVPETRLEQVHQIFLELGLKLVLVCSFGQLVGMITKKAFVQYLEQGEIGNMTRDPAVILEDHKKGLDEPLLP